MDDDRQIYEQLVRNNLEVIRERCWYFSGADKNLFAELLHEVFVDLWQSMPLFDPSYTELQQRSWVQARCRGVSKRHRTLFGTSLLPLDFDLPEDTSPEQIRESVEELAEDLSADEHRLLDLLLQGFTQRECAGLLGLSRSGVSKRYRRMLEKMKQQYIKILQQ